MLTPIQPQRTSLFFTDQATGDRYRWSFWRDARIGWMLAEPTGYVRTLERTWAESVPRIRAIADNHGCTVEVS